MSNKDLKRATIRGVFWKLSENFGTQVVSFMIQIVLARLLLPEDYGIIALTAVFLAISNVIVQTGFTSALIQKENVDEIEYSSVFFLGIGLSVIIYVLIFFSSPAIAVYFDEPVLSALLRVQSISIVLGAISSIQNAIIVKTLDFKRSFKFRILGILAQGITGIIMALEGYGVWSLVVSNLVNSMLVTVSLWFSVKWKPSASFSIKKLKNMFAYSLKVLLVNLLNTLVNNIKSLVIGKRFDSIILGYYNRGYQIPNLIMINTDGAISTVMFPVLSACQNDLVKFKQAYRRSIRTSVYLIFPIMLGLVAVAEPLTVILLTEKWLPSVPFLILNAIICMTWPFNLMYHAFNALGRSGLSLRLNVVSHALFFFTMAFALRFGVYALVISTLVGSIVTIVLGSLVLRKLINYSILEQLRDVVPAFLISIMMVMIVKFVGDAFDNYYVMLLVQLLIGVLSYVGASIAFKLDTYKYILDMIKNRSENSQSHIRL